MRLESGQKAPQFSALNHDDKKISLGRFKDKIIVLYFYPRDMTRGCTIEANEFSALIDDFSAQNAVVLGISTDKTYTHQEFIAKENLKMMLLSDEYKTISNLYGVWAEKSMHGKKYMGILRSTFIIKNGIIKHALYGVKPSGHAKQVLELVRALDS